MSRDPGEPIGPAPAAPGGSSDELLTAYVDGVSELSPADRRRIEARLAGDPAARAEQAAVRTVLDQLRSSATTDRASGAGEPDWAAMERSIRRAVSTEVPRPWWRRWKWLAPAATFATATTVMVLMWSRPTTVDGPVVISHPVTDRTTRDTPPAPDAVVPLWLDGDEVDVDLSAGDLLGDPGFGDDEPERTTATDEVRLLPATDLAWVDQLDDAALERAERWLAGKKG